MTYFVFILFSGFCLRFKLNKIAIYVTELKRNYALHAMAKETPCIIVYG